MMRTEHDKADRPLGMRPSEIEVLCQLVRRFDCQRILEIGMANASSTVMLLRTLHESGGGEVVSIDPFQYHDVSATDEVYDIGGLAACRS
jgi:predicted O-methyltransferase YrrM